MSLSRVVKDSVISRISSLGLVAGLATTMVLPAPAQAPDGRQQRGTGEAPVRARHLLREKIRVRRFRPKRLR